MYFKQTFINILYIYIFSCVCACMCMYAVLCMPWDQLFGVSNT